jgi:hypothetical protein
VLLPAGQRYQRPLSATSTTEIPGGRGRIRTFVARKERQIYSLLVLATHPPVREMPDTITIVERCRARCHWERRCAKTQNGLVSKDTSPFMLSCRNSLRLTPLPKSGGAGGGI